MVFRLFKFTNNAAERSLQCGGTKLAVRRTDPYCLYKSLFIQIEDIYTVQTIGHMSQHATVTPGHRPSPPVTASHCRSLPVTAVLKTKSIMYKLYIMVYK